MTARTRLPNRRRGDLVSFEHEGVRYTAQLGYYPNGLAAEVFLDAGKEGSAVNTMAREAAVLASIALQFGTPLKMLRDALPKLADGVTPRAQWE